jgi:1-acylglycerone phosphate reductase
VDASLQSARELFDLNVWAVLSVSQAFLPLIMKSTYGGMIVNNTSIVSVASVPMQGVYSASKAAAASLTETLRLELAPFGIKVIDMKTGAVKTNFIANMKDNHGSSLKLPESSIYAPAREELEHIMNGGKLESGMVDADVWAKTVVADLTRKSPPTVLWRGGSATLVWVAKTFFPSFLTDKLLKQAGGLDVLEKKLKEKDKRKV